jgi:hypothetical protein
LSKWTGRKLPAWPMASTRPATPRSTGRREEIRDVEFEQVGYRAYEVGITAGKEDDLVAFHSERAPVLDALFGETGQVRRFSRFVAPSSRMVEYFEYNGSLDDIRQAMRHHPNFADEEAMVNACWQFPQGFLRRIYHFEAE